MNLSESVERFVLDLLRETGMLDDFLQSYGNNAEYESAVRQYYNQFRQPGGIQRARQLARQSASTEMVQ